MEDYDKWVSQLKQNKMLSASEVEKLVIKAKEVLQKEPNVPVVRSPVTICGDIHGQFYDLIEMFKICGEPPVSFNTPQTPILTHFSSPISYLWEIMSIEEVTLLNVSN